ncbi:MAG: AI-2E family transporter [Lactobacillaceae bacterium]|jgi:predicted PurR-regulated permease PerM|nr:AI-2E family transporter [Lactobacillaceae bacterium]
MAKTANAEKKSNNWVFWLSVFAIFCYFVYLTRSVIMPFAAGILIAYLLDPFVKKLGKLKIGRTCATVIVVFLVIIAVVPALLLLLSVIHEQTVKFIGSLPTLVPAIIAKITPVLEDVGEYFPGLSPDSIREYLQSNADNAVKYVTPVLRKIVTSSLAFVNIISLLIITPIVAFYMLKDWDVFTKKIDNLLPRQQRAEIRSVTEQIDRAIAGFIRGQFSVCVILGTIYSAGLYAVGLQLGVAIGFMAGIISFIPYVGTITGFLTAMIIAFIQYDTFGPIAQVIIVFAIGQLLESYYLTPTLVGDSVGLHPVWIMFAILAGGVILGFLGILIAVPVAAIIGVLLRHFIDKYKKSPYYKD